jgi:23S rRNA pseudouridine1911/1915/1917 synthase
MKARAAEALALPEAKKQYLALIYGKMDPPAGTIDMPIKRLNEGDMLRVTAEDGQRAVTHYETLAAEVMDGIEVSLLRLYLETGRTHQIRVHCHAAGHPVLGDILYYTEESRTASGKLGIETQALHAHQLFFTEPVSGQYLKLTAKVPEVFNCLY